MEKILRAMFDVAKESYSTYTFSCDNDKVLIKTYGKYLIIAFAGSDDLKDWINNFRMDSFKEHRGFEKSFKKFKNIIDEYCTTYKESDIYITGHSRGGALATQCSEYIAKKHKPCACFTFGAPKMGNREYRNMYNKLPIHHVSVINGWDIVTTLPPIIFKRVGIKLRFKKRFWHRFIPWSKKDHSPDSYDKSIDIYYKKKR